jgi:hypothetical protein
MGWNSAAGTDVPASGYVAMALGIAFSLIVGCGLHSSSIAADTVMTSQSKPIAIGKHTALTKWSPYVSVQSRRNHKKRRSRESFQCSGCGHSNEQMIRCQRELGSGQRVL